MFIYLILIIWFSDIFTAIYRVIRKETNEYNKGHNVSMKYVIIKRFCLYLLTLSLSLYIYISVRSSLSSALSRNLSHISCIKLFIVAAATKASCSKNVLSSFSLHPNTYPPGYQHHHFSTFTFLLLWRQICGPAPVLFWHPGRPT